MLISELMDASERTSNHLANLGGPETAAIATRRGLGAAEPALRSPLSRRMNNVIQEFNLQDSVALTLNLEGDQIRMTRGRGRWRSRGPDSQRLLRANRLRLSDGLKEDIEHLATDVGSSVNSWIVRTLERSVRVDPTDYSPRTRVNYAARAAPKS